jgi:hypothetical protein
VLILLALGILRNAIGPLFQFYFMRWLQRFRHHRKGAKAHREVTIQVQELGQGKFYGQTQLPPYVVESGQPDPFSDSPFILAKRYTLKATRLVEALGKEVLTAYLTTLLVQQSATYTSSSFLENLTLYIIRPRAAPFIGLLGLFVPWAQQGLADLFIDGLLAYLAGTYVMIRFTSFPFPPFLLPPPANPAAPVAEVRTMGIGAIMTTAPAYIVGCITILISIWMTCHRKGEKFRFDILVVGALYYFVWALALVVLVILIPVFALVEMTGAIMSTIHRKKKVETNLQNDPRARKSRWLEPLSIDRRSFRLIYRLSVLSSWCINIGNWIFFASYLKLEGELYCPTETSSVLAMWILLPWGIDLVFWAFRVLTNDTSVTNGHDRNGPHGV